MKITSLLSNKIFKRISVSSRNDPLSPEFPYYNPKFPATPSYEINVHWFTNIRLKDESFNPTGTHKDRMAWEIVVTYKDFLDAKSLWITNTDVPHMSIISSWSAAYAIQTALDYFGLPNLKVLLDHKISKDIEISLQKVWCELYFTDLSKKKLEPREILMLTHNESGIDITSGTALDPSVRYYDRLSYEIINNSPQRCFIPFGTGHLYENILNTAKHQIASHGDLDQRFSWDKDIIRWCHYLWATTNNPKSLATKLYSPHLPFVHFNDQWLKFYKYAWYCGQDSNVYPIKEEYLMEAVEILENQWVKVEPSGAAWLALLLQMESVVPKNDKIVIVSTGKTKI